MYHYILSGIIAFCVVAVFIAILINFIEDGGNKRKGQEKRSIVDTGTMTAFFVAFYLIIRFRVVALTYNHEIIYEVVQGVGAAVIVLGCCVNIIGRLKLGSNWANHIMIYGDHKLVTKGVYRFVRHPLYASIIWMFFGACLVYGSLGGFLANTLIFIPFMYYRAKQEEAMLSRRFMEYNAYMKTTGMFFPKIY